MKGWKTEKSVSSLVLTFEDLELHNIYTKNLPVMLLIVSESLLFYCSLAHQIDVNHIQTL